MQRWWTSLLRRVPRSNLRAANPGVAASRLTAPKPIGYTCLVPPQDIDIGPARAILEKHGALEAHATALEALVHRGLTAAAGLARLF